MSAIITTTKARRTPEARESRAGWLHLCNGLDPRRDGGMVPSILGLTAALAGHGGSVTIVTPTPSQLNDTRIPQGVVLRGPERLPEGSTRIDLKAAVRGAEVVHLHGLWQAHSRVGARAARQARVPYLMAAHGMAEPWALRHKAIKKWAYLTLIERKNLKRAACLHALSRPEVGHLRSLAPETPICLVPNGVDLAPFENLPDRSALEAERPELRGMFVLLFFGRLHAKKGLNLLAEALSAVRQDHPDLHLLLAGSDDGALAPFLKQVAALGLSGRVTCLGHLTGEASRRAWGAADAFILPSYSEGFSMAVLEALACRLPVVITTACHFPELADAGSGITVPPTVEAVTRGLRSLLEHSAAQRIELGLRGRALVEANYTWNRQAQRLAEVYQWVAGGGEQPEAIQKAHVE
ncbi:MAG TPA: glycosyltransferase [Isosphaeraceae bacterium]|nr:glycosyltransferase [Isosphaeraceae bacterium]